jgi:predicted metal-dependent hydrolase
VPLQVTFKESEHFLYSKINWIKKQLKKISKNKESMIFLEPIDIKHARIYLEKRIIELAVLHSFNYEKLSIKNQKTRWGSCSSKNNINLNAKLLHLPAKLIDYVIMHELVHTQVKNHSKEFWLMLTSYFSDTKECDRELKKYKL